MREAVGDVLEAKGFVVGRAMRGAEGLEQVRTMGFDAAIVDIRLPDVSGVELLKSLRLASPDLEVILMAGYASLPTALQAIDGDAFAYLVKPFEMDQLVATLKKALDRQHLARALRESEERYRLIAENINDAIFLMDTQGRLVFANQRASAITGYTTNELIGRPIFSLLTPEGARRVLERLGSAVSDQDSTAVFETHLLKRDGVLVWVEANMTNVRREGQVVGRLGVLCDISERKLTEQQMRLQTGALDAAASGVVITDRGGAIIWAHPAFSNLTGYPVSEGMGPTPRLAKSGQPQPAVFRRLWGNHSSGASLRGGDGD